MQIKILRGLPGSGKSTYAERFTSAKVVSADHHMLEDGEYKFDPNKLAWAHAQCLREFLDSLIAPYATTVVVDNTNISIVELAPYVAVGRAYGLDVEIIRFGPGLRSAEAYIQTCADRNVHGVPIWKIQSMYRDMLYADSLWPRWWPATTERT